jgi:hypothetical protein
LLLLAQIVLELGVELVGGELADVFELSVIVRRPNTPLPPNVGYNTIPIRIRVFLWFEEHQNND